MKSIESLLDIASFLISPPWYKWPVERIKKWITHASLIIIEEVWLEQALGGGKILKKSRK